MVLFMNYRRNNKRFSVAGRGEYLSTSDFIVKYYTNLDACRKFFFDMKWPTGYYCEKCGCTHYYFMKSKNCYRCAHCKHDERLFTNTIFQDIIDDMFIGFKTQGLYAKTPAFYPFLGTTQAQHKWNAKNPLDTNAAFRLQFFGGGTHSNLGYQCNGTNAYANTFLVPSAVQNINSNGLTLVCGTNNVVAGVESEEIGAFSSSTSLSFISAKANWRFLAFSLDISHILFLVSFTF